MISKQVTPVEVKKIAESLALELRRGDVVTLAGDLGAGKTSFAQFLIQALSAEPVEVTSPTFNLLQTYPVQLADAARCELYHYDLYRIGHASQLVELGLEEALPNITIIEWPERLEDTKISVTLALLFRLDETGCYHLAIDHGDSRFDGIFA